MTLCHRLSPAFRHLFNHIMSFSCSQEKRPAVHIFPQVLSFLAVTQEGSLRYVIFLEYLPHPSHSLVNRPSPSRKQVYPESHLTVNHSEYLSSTCYFLFEPGSSLRHKAGSAAPCHHQYNISSMTTVLRIQLGEENRSP